MHNLYVTYVSVYLRMSENMYTLYNMSKCDRAINKIEIYVDVSHICPVTILFLNGSMYTLCHQFYYLMLINAFSSI